MKRALTLLAALAAVCLAFAAGRATAPAPPEVVVRRSATPGWVEVYRRGELVGEWQAVDGAVYDLLAGLLSH